jgi:hypothetical protein
MHEILAWLYSQNNLRVLGIEDQSLPQCHDVSNGIYLYTFLRTIMPSNRQVNIYSPTLRDILRNRADYQQRRCDKLNLAIWKYSNPCSGQFTPRGF